MDETVLQIGEVSGIVILFIAGLEITPREFLKGGAASFTVGYNSNHNGSSYNHDYSHMVKEGIQ